MVPSLMEMCVQIVLTNVKHVAEPYLANALLALMDIGKTRQIANHVQTQIAKLAPLQVQFVLLQKMDIS